MSYWRTPSGSEIDFVWERGDKRIGIEVKASKRWRTEFGSALAGLRQEGRLTAAFGVYTGAERQKERDLTVLPFVEFTRALTAGTVLA